MYYKRTAALLLTVLLALLLNIPTFAATPTLTVESVSAGKGDEVDVSILITNNTGFAAMTLSIGYDKDALTYKSFEKGILSDYTVKDHPSNGIVRLVNVENGNLTKNGKLITLKFTVNKDAGDGLHPITIHLKSGDICDWDLNSITPEIVSGGVTVGLNNSSLAENFTDNNTSSDIKVESGSDSSDTESSESLNGNSSAEKMKKSAKQQRVKKQKSNNKIIYLIIVLVVLPVAVILVFIFRNRIFRREKV